MPTHEQFEELCALAAAGEMDGANADVLEQHLEECASCRGVFADVSEIQAQWLPSHPDFASPPDGQVERRLRQTILRRAREQGAHFSEAASTGARGEAHANWGFYLRFSGMAALVSFCAVFVVLALRSGPDVQTKSSLPANVVRSDAIAARSSENRQSEELLQARQASEMLSLSLERARAEVVRLRGQLQEEQAKRGASDRIRDDAQSRAEELTAQLDEARATLAKREAEFVTVKARADTNDAVALAEQREIEQLRSDAAAKGANLDREREMLSAGREIRDLIAARNLHIIDVYDTNIDGRTSKAFGRVFYTEGKSLVFYAYDLSARQANTAKFSFYLWGKRDGAPQYVKVLGRLNKDDQLQKRWALTITDPKMLAEIDSVFVTLEPTGNGASKPSGKPLLSAFLGSPANHP
jgi:Putative zinc-finger